MEDFDILYMVKTPFFLGDNNKAIEEAEHMEINEEDIKNKELLNFFLIRSLDSISNL